MTRANPTKFAALKYVGTRNIGDEIQTLAASRFLPRVDAWVDRDRLDEFQNAEDHKIILNGWFLHRPQHWPPAPQLKPLITSFHLTKEVMPRHNELMIAPSSTVLGPTGIAYLRDHAPIGARDLDTLETLLNAGVDAYFSGCLTLTLEINGPEPRSETVYAVDLPEDVVTAFETRCGAPIVRVSHIISDVAGPARFGRARELLRCYASAHAVLTSRLHCALPCLALGVPVLFVPSAQDSYRFSGLRDFLHCASREELLANPKVFDLSSPPENSTAWHPLRDRLNTLCEQFVRSG